MSLPRTYTTLESLHILAYEKPNLHFDISREGKKKSYFVRKPTAKKMTGEQLTESQYKIALQPVQRRRGPNPGPKQLEQYVSRLSFDRAAT